MSNTALLRKWCLGAVVGLFATGALAEDWITLFNGKDLEGWTPKIKGYEFGDNFADTFRVEDGMITVSYDGYDSFDGKFGHLFYKTPYSHYRILIEHRFIGEQAEGGPGWANRNSGAMLHCQDPKSMTIDQDFPVSIEAQLLGGDGENARTTCNMCSPGTHIEMDGELVKRHCVESESKTFHGDQWVIAEMEVRGDESIKHFINGELVMEYQKPQLDPADKDAKSLVKNGDVSLAFGYISLQSESHPVQFRRVELLPLEP
jgi:hypothetical protein